MCGLESRMFLSHFTRVLTEAFWEEVLSGDSIWYPFLSMSFFLLQTMIVEEEGPQELSDNTPSYFSEFYTVFWFTQNVSGVFCIYSLPNLNIKTQQEQRISQANIEFALCEYLNIHAKIELFIHTINKKRREYLKMSLSGSRDM